jgi:hypothetical protein
MRSTSSFYSAWMRKVQGFPICPKPGRAQRTSVPMRRIDAALVEWDKDQADALGTEPKNMRKRLPVAWIRIWVLVMMILINAACMSRSVGQR